VLSRTPVVGGEEREGNYRFLVCNNGISNPVGAGNIDGWGGVLNFDQEISDNVTIFGRLGLGESNVTVSDFSYSFGLQINEPNKIKNSSTGFAYQYADLTAGGTQKVGEWFYRTKWQEDSSLYIGPVIQYYEDDSLNGSVIFGFRTSYSF
jgi:hypothetical protein